VLCGLAIRSHGSSCEQIGVQNKKLKSFKRRNVNNPESLYPVYTIQPVVKPGCTTSLTTALNEQPLFVQPVVKPGLTIDLTTGCIHDTTGLTTGCFV